MIIRLDSNTTETAFQIGPCDKLLTCGEWICRITKASCKEPWEPPVKKDSTCNPCKDSPAWVPADRRCPPYAPCPPKPTGLLIEYPAWKVDTESVTFLWDDLLLSLPKGRYRGVLLKDGEQVHCFGIDLKSSKTRFTTVEHKQDCISCGEEVC